MRSACSVSERKTVSGWRISCDRVRRNSDIRWKELCSRESIAFSETVSSSSSSARPETGRRLLRSKGVICLAAAVTSSRDLREMPAVIHALTACARMTIGSNRNIDAKTAGVVIGFVERHSQSHYELLLFRTENRRVQDAEGIVTGGPLVLPGAG